MTAPTQRPASTSDAAKRKAETEGRCWRGECRTGCYYPDVCSERAPTPAEPDADELVEAFARDLCAADPTSAGPATWEVVRENHRDYRREHARALMALGYSRTPDAHLAAAKAEVLEGLRERLVAAEQQLRERAPTFWESVERERVSGKAQGVQLALSYVDEAIRLREQGGDQ